jgi:hypothetical protein
VKAIVEGHGGKVELNSRPASPGLRAKLILPRS